MRAKAIQFVDQSPGDRGKHLLEIKTGNHLERDPL
jgi:hypothetical protein